MWFYNQFYANRHGVNFRQSLTPIVNSFHDVTKVRRVKNIYHIYHIYHKALFIGGVE